MDHEIVRYLMEIQERLSSIEAKLDDHVSHSSIRDQKVDRLEKKVVKAEASIKAVKWLAGILFITLPASTAAVFRIWRG